MPFDFWCRFKETIFLRCNKLFTEIVSVFIPLERGKLEKNSTVIYTTLKMVG